MRRTEPTATMQYSVNYWGSHPDADNDDCHTGEDFATLAEAEAAFAAEVPTAHYLRVDTAYVELTVYTGRTIDGAREIDTVKVRQNPDYRPRCDSDDDWRREIAMEAGMLHGVDGYNEVMGW